MAIFQKRLRCVEFKLVKHEVFRIIVPVMKTVSLLSAILMLPAASLLAKGPSEIEILRTRIDVQERRISQLENALNRLQGNPVAKKTGSTKQAPSKAVPVAETTDSKEYVVVKGDILTRIAHRHHTTVTAIKKENALKSDALRVGQKLRISSASPAAVTQSTKAEPQAVAKKAPSSQAAVAKAVKGKYTVKAGDTFYGIARQHKMSEATLQAANPKAKPTRLQIGQVLVIDASAKTQAKVNSKTVEKKPTKVAQKSSSKSAKSPEVKKSAVAKAPVKKSPVASAAPPVVKKPSSIRTITVQKQMTYGAFASQHGASTSQLNSLNGLQLSKSTMLAKGSELYVPQY